MRSYIRYLVVALVLLMLMVIYLTNSRKDDSGPIREEQPHIDINSRLKRFWHGDELPILPSRSDRADHVRPKGRTAHLRDLIKISPKKAINFDFSECRMSNCFDYTRCNSSGPIKIHVLPPMSNQNNDFLNISGESNMIHTSLLSIIKESDHYEPDPQKACLFMLSDDTLDRDPLSKSFRTGLPELLRPEHMFGMNYLIINLYSGTWPDYRENDFANFNIGAAILAKASNSLSNHRPNFDISIPLFSYMHPTSRESFSLDREQEPTRARTYFLTFKGKRYVLGGGSMTRNSLYHLNNQRDVIMLTTCRHGKKWREASDSRCEDDDSTYEKYQFDALMRNSTFCLTPRGRRLGSFRFLEALSYDCIPVVLSDGWVWPFEEVIDWSQAALQFEEGLVFHVTDILRDLDLRTIHMLQRNCRKYYEEYFSTKKKIILTTLSVIERRLKYQLAGDR